MGFKASQVSKLDYDFNPKVNVKGVSPDPSDDEVYDFQLAMRDAAKKLNQDLDPNDQAAVMDFMSNLTREDFKEVNEIIFEAVAAMLHDQPSKDDLMALSKASYRHAQAYMGSLMADVMDPKTVKNAMKE